MTVPRVKRQSAFDVSFPGEANSSDSVTPPSTSTTASGQIIANASGSKRKGVHTSGSRSTTGLENTPSKRQRLICYTTPQHTREVKETELNEDEEVNGVQKPIWLLTDFTIFDPSHRNEIIPLSSMEDNDGTDRQFEAAGYVAPLLEDEEDAGQEDAIDGEPLPFVRLGALLRFTYDYHRDKDPVYIETELAWYLLRVPSTDYRVCFQGFFNPRRIAQIVIASATTSPHKSLDKFLEALVNEVDATGRRFQESDLWNAVPNIREAIEEAPQAKLLEDTILIRHILKKIPPDPNHIPRQRIERGPPPPQLSQGTLRGLNLDLAVLKPENQTKTHVTPAVHLLTQEHIDEVLQVVGPSPRQTDKLKLKLKLDQDRKQLFRELSDFIKIANQEKVVIENVASKGSKQTYLKSIKINGQIYQPGDVIIVPNGRDGEKTKYFPSHPREIPFGKVLADYFWFARIIYIHLDLSIAHVQWFTHGMHIGAMEEFAKPQELFLNNLCDPIKLKAIVGKVNVHFAPKGPILYNDYFYKFVYDTYSPELVTPDALRTELTTHQEPPDNCPVCQLEDHKTQEADPRVVKDGVAYHGHTYHLNDFFLYQATTGPANIGCITKITAPAKDASPTNTVLTVRPVGRVSELGNILPADEIKDERHVFILTDAKKTVPVALEDAIRVCFVFALASLGSNPDAWLSLSPDHFYVKYSFPGMRPTSWDHRKSISASRDLPSCDMCVGQALADKKHTDAFLAYMKSHPLPVLDLFGGVGAFSESLAEGTSGCLKVTHAIEISPSAAKTFKRNSPDTVVYNQCVNTMLRYAIKRHEGHSVETPTQLYDDNIPVPDPPRPGSIKVVVGGFPCQSHSSLNMFRNANDPKSNLILTTLSWIDYLRPDFCYFENVRGFLSYRLGAVQKGPHRVEGGIEMGGLKLLHRSLSDMGYQVRCGLLQAAHYGAPQDRIRFFLWGAIEGQLLPAIPQPSHYFPLTDRLIIKFPLGDQIQPIRSKPGTAPLPMVTIDDAIGDLPRFDWKHPNPKSKERKEMRERERLGIKSVACKKTDAYAGLPGVVQYHHEPKTRYQIRARAKPTTDLQHYTRVFVPKKVERTIAIPLEANADYRGLPSRLHEFQSSNPMSAVARGGYKPGLYGRLDKDHTFNTTVTNVDPTAKQCRVLNPYCKRIVTVRELARSQGFPDSFVFEAEANNVVTMHRQIGNAVPWQVGAALGREFRIALEKSWVPSKAATPVEVIEIETDSD